MIPRYVLNKKLSRCKGRLWKAIQIWNIGRFGFVRVTQGHWKEHHSI